ncbi:MAG: hypothetical protein M0P39_04605 [Rhodocyclaceae bacterium]|jgi:hypothetical protein|nr:hypothetical protein [Rhodocyclaceae bacterium]
MSEVPPDGMAELASPEVQRLAARTAQEAFARVFRLSLGESGDGLDVAALRAMLRNWCAAAGSEEARSLRLALLVAGMDQWGLAYSQAFGLVSIPALSQLLGDLRTGLDVRDDARFQQQFAALDATEGNAVDFKVALRRDIHLALWHAMIACEEREEAQRILGALGGLLLASIKAMPQLGWRLVADALAHVQIRCLADGLASDGLARETNEELFASLAHALPKDDWSRIMAHAAQAVLAWQQARRAH